MKFLKKLIVISAIGILSCAFLLVSLCLGLYLYSRASIDKENDERLFNMAKEPSVSYIYYNLYVQQKL